MPEYIGYWACVKGVTIVGTGDCTHPRWLGELREKLEDAGNGLYRLKKKYALSGSGFPLPSGRREAYFILTGEISSIYKKNGKVRRVHNLCVLPDFSAAKKLQKALAARGNIESDGRPILGVDAKDILDIVLNSADGAYLIPAHIWTPWFSVLGDKGGFDSLEECFGDLTKHIFAVETGLSSDPPMNRRCSFLDNVRLVSNSDAHSPANIGREANIFTVEPGYASIYRALRSGRGFPATIECFPQQGKYYFDGHRNCNVCFSPRETVRHKGICPVCHKPLTIGVAHRVAELSDRPGAHLPGNGKDNPGICNRRENRGEQGGGFDDEKSESVALTTVELFSEEKVPHWTMNSASYSKIRDYYSTVPLPELISGITGTAPSSQKTQHLYFEAIEKIGPELYTLLFSPPDEIKKAAGEQLSEAISRLRKGKVYVKPGYDGVFGKVTVSR